MNDVDWAEWIAGDGELDDLPAVNDLPPAETKSGEDITQRLRPVPIGMEEESALCPRCRRRATPTGRIGLRLVFEHCGVHFFRPPRGRPSASVRGYRLELVHAMRSRCGQL